VRERLKRLCVKPLPKYSSIHESTVVDSAFRRQAFFMFRSEQVTMFSACKASSIKNC